MVPILLAMLGIVLLAVLVVVYVAYPHRGQDVPRAAWLGRTLRSGVERLPTLDDGGSSHSGGGRDEVGRDALERQH